MHIHLTGPEFAVPSTNKADQLSMLSDVHLLKHPLHQLKRLVHTWDTGLPCCVLLPSWVPRLAEQNHWTAARAQSCPANPGDTKINHQKSLGVSALPSASWFLCLVAKHIYATKKKLSAAISDSIDKIMFIKKSHENINFQRSLILY